jgi:hypothetical protein
MTLSLHWLRRKGFIMVLHRQSPRHWLAMGALLLGLTMGTAAAAQELPSRVGRVARIQGDIALYLPTDRDNEGPEVIAAPLNWPVARGQRLVTEDGASAEISVGSMRWRLGARTELRVLDLDEHAVRLELRQGTLAVLMPESDDAREVEVLVDGSRIRPKGRGLFRLDLDPGQDPIISIDQGSLTVVQPDNALTLRAGQTVQWQADGDWRRVAPRRDEFARWAMRNNLPSPSRFVSTDTTGFEDLERHGRWEPTREWGMAWFPRDIDTDWAPYSQGRWAWVSPWGWTWIDAAPWGFATSHYGRWVQERGRWAWLPDDVAQPTMYAPARVTWSNEPIEQHRYSRQADFAPGYFWTPLGPRERYQTVILPQRPMYREERRHPHRPEERARDEGPRIMAPVRVSPALQPAIVLPAPAQPVYQRDRPSGNVIRAGEIRLAPGLQAPVAPQPQPAIRQERPREVPQIQPAQPAQPVFGPPQPAPARPVIQPAVPVLPTAPTAPAAKPVPPPIQATPAPEPAKEEPRKRRHDENR